jgi:O-antigen/teichoic acid export membrane protein
MMRALASIGAIQLLIMLVALVRAKILATSLGPAGFGVLSTIDQAVLTVVQVSALSMPFTALRLMAKSHSQGEAPFRQAFVTFFRMLTVLAVGTVVLCSALLAWRPGVFGEDLIRYRQYLAVALLSLPALLLQILFVNTLAAAQAPAASATLSLVVGLVLAVASVSGALAAGIRGFYVAGVSAGILTTGGALWYLSRRFGFTLATRPMSLAQTLSANPEIVTQSALVWVALTAYSVTLFVTRYAVLSLLGETHAGLLQAQLSLALTVGAVVAPMSGLYLAPLVNRELAARDKASAADQFAAKVAVFLLLGGLPLILFPKLIVSLLYSPAFAPAVDVLFVFVLWQCLYQIVNVYLQLLIGLDDVAFFAIITCAAYSCAATLFPLLIPDLGIAGAALGLVVSMLVAATGAVVRLRTRFGHAVSATVWRRAGYTLAVIAIGGLVFSPNTEGTASGITMRAVYALLAIGAVWFGLTPEERGLIMALFRFFPATTSRRAFRRRP